MSLEGFPYKPLERIRFHMIVNGSAGSVQRERVLAALRIGLPQLEPELHLPPSVSELQKIIRDLPSGENLVIAGGDGTLQCALPELVRTRKPFVVLPLGTANDFATYWGYNPDLLSVYYALSRRIEKKVDVLSCNDVFFATVGGLGVGALLTRDFNAMRRKSLAFRKISQYAGTNIYTGLAAATIVGRRSYLRKYEIETESGRRAGLFSNVFVCNQPRLGGDLLVAPEATPTDGAFDVLFLRAQTPAELLISLAKLRMNQEPQLSERVRCKKMTVRAEDGKGHLLFADGESFEFDGELNFTVHPHALTLLTSGGSRA